MLTKQMKMFSFLTIILLLLVSGCTPIRPLSQAANRQPMATVPLPVGFRPEGIALGAGSEFFAGSLGTIAGENKPIVGGAIYRGDLLTGQGQMLVEPQENAMAVGLHFDARTGYLFVAGGMMGDVRVYQATTGKLLARYVIGAKDGFINDLATTQDALYATDSFVPVLYRIPLAADGKLVEGAKGETIKLGGDYAVGAGEYPFQANGIVTTPDGKWLIIVNSDTGKLYRVDPATGATKAIELGDKDVHFGDGLVLAGQMLYVVQNYANQLTAVQLSADFAKASLSGTVTKAAFAFKIPTTAVKLDDALYVINGRYEESAPLTPGSPDIDYAVLRVPVSALR
ncbi:MAG: hypothetical protein U0350_06780 [Caldilineaceae bacterium]